jgi:MutS domain V
MKVHLLFADEDFNFWAAPVPSEEALVQDLELDRVFAAMARADPYIDKVVRQVVPHGLCSPSAIRYRQDVLRDFIMNPELATELYAVCVRSVEERKGNWGIWGRSSTNPTSILSGSVRELEMYVRMLKELKSIVETHATKVRSQGLKGLVSSLQENLTDEYFATIEDHLQRLRFREGVLMSAVLGPDLSGRDFVLRRPTSAKATWRQKLGIGPKDGYSFTVPPRDEAASQAIENLRSRGVNQVANAVARSSEHVQSYFTVLQSELAFYLGCLNLRSALSEKGVALCFPDPSPTTPLELHAVQLRDPSLALQSTDTVFGNDVRADGKPLIIVTGANSGGKSTFLRSLGLAQVFMQCGSLVAAESFGASTRHGVFIHFIREEDPSMTHGRLDDELARMSQIIDTIRSGALLLCNESFASTNEREGSEIGRQVVRALLDVGVRVVYVTHQYDFAESFHTSQIRSAVLFLAAERDEDGARNFKVAEHEPQPTSYGADLYTKVFAEP